MRKFLARLLLFVVSVVVFGGLALYKIETDVIKSNPSELLVQTAVIPAEWLPHKLNPTYGYGGSPESLKHHQTHNAQGFKYPIPVAKEKGKKVIRIFGMGGSTLYGWGAEGLKEYDNHPHLANDETITYFIEKKINDALRDKGVDFTVEVINAAVIDYNSAFHLVYYNQTITEYNPDIVFFLDGNNEFFGITPWNTFSGYKNSSVNIIESFNDRKPYFTLYVAARYLAKFSNYFNGLQYKALSAWLSQEAPTINKIYELPENFDGFDESYDIRAKSFLRTYAQLKAAIEFDHAKPVLFLGPQLVNEDTAKLSPKDTQILAEVQKSMLGTAMRGEFMHRVRARLPRDFASIGLPYYDVSELAAPENMDKRLYIDYTHVTPVGAEIIARKMYGPLYERVMDIVKERSTKVDAVQ